MALHLAHKIPWGSLTELFKLFPRSGDRASRRNKPLVITLREKNKASHFARCFAAAVQEFRESDQSTDEERRLYDPRTWPGQRESGIGGHIGFVASLLTGYMYLNLTLSEPEVFLPFLFPNGRPVYMIQVMLGHYDGGHPPHIAQHLREALDEAGRLKPFTAEVAQVFRDHAAIMFRCMYSVSGDTLFVSEKEVRYEVLALCRLDYPPDWQT